MGRERGIVEPRHRMNRRHGIFAIRFRFRTEEWVQSCFSAADDCLYYEFCNITDRRVVGRTHMQITLLCSGVFGA